jgi:hypothetical protein
MKNLFFILVILSVAISATFAVECYYCGLRKACNDPFDGSTTDKVTCSVGCLKIDAVDPQNKNKRKLARGCGDLTTTVCEENKEKFGLTGELCSCTTNLCNGVQKGYLSWPCSLAKHLLVSTRLGKSLYQSVNNYMPAC